VLLTTVTKMSDMNLTTEDRPKIQEQKTKYLMKT